MYYKIGSILGRAVLLLFYAAAGEQDVIAERPPDSGY